MPASAAASEAAFPPSPEYPKSDTTSPKRVLLRRPLQAVPSTSEIPSDGDSAFGGSPTTERRKVLLAHKIKPGQTIQLKASKATATMRDDPDTQTDIHAESLVHAASRPIGPQYGAEGNLLSFSVLGPKWLLDAVMERCCGESADRCLLAAVAVAIVIVVVRVLVDLLVRLVVVGVAVVGGRNDKAHGDA